MPFYFGTGKVKKILKERGGEKGDTLYILKSFFPSIKNWVLPLKKKGVEIELLTPGKFQKLTGKSPSLKVALWKKELEPLSSLSKEKVFFSSSFQLFFALDKIQDPQNIGTIARAVYVLGGGGIILSRNRTAPISSSSIRASAGYLPKVPVLFVSNLYQFLLEAKEKGVYIVATSPQGEPISDAWIQNVKEHFSSVILILGNEEKGVSPLLLKKSHEVISIPQKEKSASLNVSQAAAILLYAFLQKTPVPHL